MPPSRNVCFLHGRVEKRASGVFLLQEQGWNEILRFARMAKEAGEDQIALRDVCCPDCGDRVISRDGREVQILMCLYHGRLCKNGVMMREQGWGLLKRLMVSLSSEKVPRIKIDHKPCPDCDCKIYAPRHVQKTESRTIAIGHNKRRRFAASFFCWRY